MYISIYFGFELGPPLTAYLSLYLDVSYGDQWGLKSLPGGSIAVSRSGRSYDGTETVQLCSQCVEGCTVHRRCLVAPSPPTSINLGQSECKSEVTVTAQVIPNQAPRGLDEGEITYLGRTTVYPDEGLNLFGNLTRFPCFVWYN